MDVRSKASIEEAKEILIKSKDPFHDIYHTEGVIYYAEKIMEYYKEANKDIVLVACWWHDTGRIYGTEGHEKKSAEMAFENLRAKGYSENFCRKIARAIEFHKWNMCPETLEGEIVRDADKLNFINMERWERTVGSSSLVYIRRVIELLPDLRNGILHLEKSRVIYDQIFPDFNKYLEKIRRKEIYSDIMNS